MDIEACAPANDPFGDYTGQDLDPEAHLSCAALWAKGEAALLFVVDRVRGEDFANPFHRPIYAAINEAMRAGRPHEPTSTSMTLVRAGSAAVPPPVYHPTCVRSSRSAR